MPRKHITAAAGFLFAGIVVAWALTRPDPAVPARAAAVVDSGDSPVAAGLVAPDLRSAGGSAAPGTQDSAGRGEAPARVSVAADSARIRGRVVFPAGTPTGEEVSLAIRDASLAGARLAGGRATVQVGHDGLFEARLGGHVELARIELNGTYLYLPRTVEHEVSDDPIELRPRLGGRIEVTLACAEEHDAFDLTGGLIGATSSSTKDSRVRTTARVRDTGSQVLVAGPVGPGSYFLLLSSKTHVVPVLDGVRVEAGLTTPITIEPRHGFSARGVVLDSGGAAVEGALLRLLIEPEIVLAGGRRLPRTTSDEHGAFSFEVIEPGRVTLQADHARHGWAQLELGDPGDGEQREGLVVRLDGARVLAGRVRFDDGSPACDVRVEIGQADFVLGAAVFRDRVRSTRTDDAGRFELRGLNPFPCSLSASARSDGETFTARSDEIEPNRIDVELVLVSERPDE